MVLDNNSMNKKMKIKQNAIGDPKVPQYWRFQSGSSFSSNFLNWLKTRKQFENAIAQLQAENNLTEEIILLS